MNFLFTLTILLAFATAHMDMFRPAVDCAAEKTEEQLAMEAAKVERMKEDLPVACELLAEKEAEEAVSTQSDERKRKAPKGGRGVRDLMKVLTTEMCTAAEESPDAVVEKILEERDPCTNSFTLETVLEKVRDMCAESQESESSSSESEETEDTTEREDVEETEDTTEDEDVEQLVAQLMARMGRGKERKEGKERREKETPAVCEMSEEDLTATYKAFFSADAEPINSHEADLGWRKMKVMQFMDSNFSENCVQNEETVVEEEADVVEEETEETDAEEERETLGLIRRFLRGGHGGHKGRKPSMGGKPGKGERPSKEERPGKGRGEEKRENPAMEVVSAFKDGCVAVTTDSVNALFADVQAAVEKAKEEAVAETVVEEDSEAERESETDVVKEQPKREKPSRGRRGRGGRTQSGRVERTQGGRGERTDSGRVERTDSGRRERTQGERGERPQSGRGERTQGGKGGRGGRGRGRRRL